MQSLGVSMNSYFIAIFTFCAILGVMEAQLVWQVLQCSSVNSCIQEVRLILTPTLILTEATGLRAQKKKKKPGNWKKEKPTFPAAPPAGVERKV